MIRRRIWRQGNSAVVTLSPIHLEHMDLSIGQFVDLDLHYIPPLGDFFLSLQAPGLNIDFGAFKFVDNPVDNPVDK